MSVVGRFAPSPTGPLHLGSLVAAVGSWLNARKAGGRWLVRMEDLDAPRVVAGSAEEILEALRCYGLEWDGEVVWQSRRTNLYEDALQRLRAHGLVYDCGCSRADLQHVASAPNVGPALSRSARAESPGHISEAIYPGTCRSGLPPGRAARAIRFRAPDERIAFDDAIHGRIEENVAAETGDFVIKRADGPFAYQLAVVVDDEDQGVTQVVRGGDLLSSTARQIALQRALGLPTPSYAHLPLVVGPNGAKLGKREAALPLPTLDHGRVRSTLAISLQILGVEVSVASPREMLEEALRKPFSTSPGPMRSSITEA